MSSYKRRDDSFGQLITRRRLLVTGGATLVGTTLLGPFFQTVFGQSLSDQDLKRLGIMSKDGGTKPTFLP